jgi:hypothetical protein
LMGRFGFEHGLDARREADVLAGMHGVSPLRFGDVRLVLQSEATSQSSIGLLVQAIGSPHEGDHPGSHVILRGGESARRIAPRTDER